ncbi:unnamed protein product [Laminaria digitata]
MWATAFANAPPVHSQTLAVAPASRLCGWRHRDNNLDLVRVDRFHRLFRPVFRGVRQQQPEHHGENGGERDSGLHRNSCNSPLDNPRLPVPNEYLAGWALTQNDTACLKRLQAAIPFHPATTAAAPAPASSAGGNSSMKSWLAESPEWSGGRGNGLWGEATRALMDRVDIVRDVDQRRLATSRYWQRLQENPPAASSVDDESSSLSWADVSSLFEQDKAFVWRERERLLEEAAMGMPEGWKEDRTSRAWVASYRLSVFEIRRQAQLFFSWGIPDERALDCILEPGKRVLEVGSGLGYWAHLLKMRSGDDTRVRCLDPYAPKGKTPPLTSENFLAGESDLSKASTGEGDLSTVQPSATEPFPEAEVDDVWFGEGRAPFSPAERGSFEKIDEDSEHYQVWSLLVCWPSDGEWPEGCLRAFRGDDFFYVGEAEGGATRMPWRLLREEWQLERRVEIPRWPGFKDALWWYRRRGAAPLSPEQ